MAENTVDTLRIEVVADTKRADADVHRLCRLKTGMTTNGGDIRAIVLP